MDNIITGNRETNTAGQEENQEAVVEWQGRKQVEEVRISKLERNIQVLMETHKHLAYCQQYENLQKINGIGEENQVKLHAMWECHDEFGGQFLDGRFFQFESGNC